MTAAAIRWRVFAPEVVKALLTRERDVMAYIQAFAEDRAPADRIDVAGPPTKEDLKTARAKGQQSVPLPCVTLRLKKTPHHLDRVPTIYVTCSDADLAEIARWNVLAPGPAPTGPRLYN